MSLRFSDNQAARGLALVAEQQATLDCIDRVRDLMAAARAAGNRDPHTLPLHLRAPRPRVVNAQAVNANP